MKKPNLNDIYTAVALNCKHSGDCFAIKVGGRIFQCDSDLGPGSFGNRYFVANEVTKDDILLR